MPKYARKKKTTYASQPKRRYYRKKSTAPRKVTYVAKKRSTRRLRSGSGSYAKRMQDNTFQYTKKKYTAVFPVTCPAGRDSVSTTISIMGGKNSSSPDDCITLAQCNPDDLLTNDMVQHQHFKITGMQSKLFFPEGTDQDGTPVQWSMAYSGSQVVNPAVGFGPIQTLSTFQTSSCDSSRPITRYFVPNRQLQRLGVDWATCAEYNTGAWNADPPTPLYGGQLPVNNGSSLYLKVTRGTQPGEGTQAQIARLQVTFYVTYRGVLGDTSII